jgi:ABC-type nitrate/sulfonate/bicarbonate transport system substrate-binding protein
VERTPLNLRPPEPLVSKEIEWIVVTPENAEETWKRLKEKNTDLVLFAITDEGYETLSLTMATLRNFIAQQRTIILKYQEYYEPKDTEKK